MVVKHCDTVMYAAAAAWTLRALKTPSSGIPIIVEIIISYIFHKPLTFKHER